MTSGNGRIPIEGQGPANEECNEDVINEEENADRHDHETDISEWSWSEDVDVEPKDRDLHWCDCWDPEWLHSNESLPRKSKQFLEYEEICTHFAKASELLRLAD